MLGHTKESFYTISTPSDGPEAKNRHYANRPMQNVAILKAVKNEKKICSKHKIMGTC